jgi:hypothetical protein
MRVWEGRADKVGERDGKKVPENELKKGRSPQKRAK